MKSKLSIPTATKTLLAGLAFAAMHTDAGTIGNGLVAVYDFETDLSNKVGAGDLAVTGGGGIAGWSGGIVNAGDGTSDRTALLAGNAGNFVDIENDRTLAPFGSSELGDSFAISAWYNLSPNTNNPSTRFFVFESSNSFDVSYGTTSSPDTYASYVGQSFVDSTVTSRNEWHHALHNFESDGSTTTLSVYIDGTLVGTGSVATSSVDFPSIYFGRARNGSGDRDWDGLIDEIGIWNRTLTTEEIGTVYQLGLSGQSIPSPSAALAGLIGLGGLMARRRRSA